MSESTVTEFGGGGHHNLHAEQVGVKKSLGHRHVEMIGIGGAIGTVCSSGVSRGCIALANSVNEFGSANVF